MKHSSACDSYSFLSLNSFARLSDLVAGLVRKAVGNLIFVDAADIQHRLAVNEGGCGIFDIVEPDIRVEAQLQAGSRHIDHTRLRSGAAVRQQLKREGILNKVRGRRWSCRSIMPLPPGFPLLNTAKIQRKRLFVGILPSTIILPDCREHQPTFPLPRVSLGPLPPCYREPKRQVCEGD